MMKYILMVIFVLFLLGCARQADVITDASDTMQKQGQNMQEMEEEMEEMHEGMQQNMGMMQQEPNTIEIISSGFSPKTLTISQGDAVTFVNKDTNKHWPASDPHPVHTAYPDKGGCIDSMFDACHGLITEEAFTFIFNQKGTWNYHNHLNPGVKGKIVVQ